MRHLSKFSIQVTKSSSLNNTRNILAPCLINLQHNSTRLSSDAIQFLDQTNSATIKRGAGGRSSYSGVTATIFGATGFLGKFVCNGLGKIGTQMVIPYRGEHYDVMPLKLAGDLGQVLFTPYHVCDEDSIRKAVKYSSVVINLVGRDWHTKNFTMHEANALSAERIARISKEMGVKKFIHLSALNCNIEYEGYLKAGGSEFLKAKYFGEKMVREIYPNAVIFRPSDVYGQQDRFIRSLLSTFRYTVMNYIALPNKGKDIFKKPVFAGDLSAGIINAVYNPDSYGKLYDAVGPRYYEYNELIHWLHRVTKRSYYDNQSGVLDIKYDLVARLKAIIFEKLPSDPVGFMTTDRIERDAITDVTCNNPTLEDLGVTLTLLEDRIKWETWMFNEERLIEFIETDEYGDVVPEKQAYPAPHYK